MINESIKAVYCPTTDDEWYVVETDRRCYELRMGGYRSVASVDMATHSVLHEFGNVTIKDAHTDDDAVYIHLSSGMYLIHSFSVISADGSISASARLLTQQQFIDQYGDRFLSDPELRRLKTDLAGNSQLCS
jgi:hypothetical protein